MYLFALRKNTAQLVVTAIICIDFYFRSEIIILLYDKSGPSASVLRKESRLPE